jgi:hypothetical protein
MPVARDCLVATALVGLAFPWPRLSLAQAASAPEREAQIVAQIETAEARGGENSAALIEPLTDLGLLREQQGDLLLAVAAFSRARDITRVNHGFSTLDEAQLLRYMVRTENARGNAAGAWKFEQEALELAYQNPHDVRSAQIFGEVAENRMRVLGLYRAGKLPPEIVLGCYYAKISSVYQLLNGEADLDPNPPPFVSCTNGYRSVALLALLMEARTYDGAAIDVVLQSSGYASDELDDFVVDALRKTEVLRAFVPTYDDPFITDLLERLSAHEPTDALSLRRHAEILVHSADLSVLRAHDARRYTGLDPVLVQYQKAFEELVQAGAGPAAVGAMFSPEIPVVLPAFHANPFVTDAGKRNGDGHVDVAFEITKYGKGTGARIVDATGNASRSVQKELIRLIEDSTFRPRVVDGRIADAAPVTLRYYPRAPTE